MNVVKLMPLIKLKKGEKARFATSRNTPQSSVGPASQARIEDMGIRAGKIAEVLQNEGNGPILLKIDESRVALGRKAATEIMVEKFESTNG